MNLTTVGDINRACRRFTPVVARLTYKGQDYQARIIRARMHQGVLQGLILGARAGAD